MSKDTIYREDAIKAIEKHIDDADDQYCLGLNTAINALKDIPSVEPKQGEWINRYCGEVWVEQYCSQCGVVIEDEPMDYNFCPNCGARMKGADDDAD